MTDWKRVDLLRKKKAQVSQDTDYPDDLRIKIIRAIETQIQQEFELTERCQLPAKTR